MKRISLLLALPLVCALSAAYADDYVDDLYFTEAAAVEQQIKSGDLKPQYDKSRMQELVFEDVEPLQSDTVSLKADTASVPVL